MFPAIRDRRAYARIVVLASRYILLGDVWGNENSDLSFKLVIDKMNRLFFFKSGKYYSVAYPFHVRSEEGEIAITSRSGIEVTLARISSVLSILGSNEQDVSPSLQDYPLSKSGASSIDVSLTEEVFAFEPGYVRYEFDPEREDGHRHPLYHLDINYANPGKYKFGVANELAKNEFIDLLQVNTDCKYVMDA